MNDYDVEVLAEVNVLGCLLDPENGIDLVELIKELDRDLGDWDFTEELARYFLKVYREFFKEDFAFNTGEATAIEEWIEEVLKEEPIAL